MRRHGGHATEADVAIVGAGPAGSATAISLRAAGIERVTLLEQGDVRRRPPVGESIPPETALLLRRLGAWERFVADGHEPCLGSASSWGSEALGYNDFVCNPHGSGWHLDRSRFDASLLQVAVERGASVRHGAHLKRVVGNPEDGFVLELTGGDRLTAGFVVDASGPPAALGRGLGARRRCANRLSCVAGVVALPDGCRLNRATMLEAVSYGWWYAARIPGGRASVVLATSPRDLGQRRLHTEQGWTDYLRQTSHVGPVLAGATLVGTGVHVWAAMSTLLEPCAGDAWVAVGDAASTFDPLSSQGIHKALADALDATAAIASWFDGRAGELVRYRAGVEDRFDGYQRDRDYLYSIEDRWPHAPFWRAQRPPTDTPEGTMQAAAVTM